MKGTTVRVLLLLADKKFSFVAGVTVLTQLYLESVTVRRRHHSICFLSAVEIGLQEC
jgi:hypothetical protein